MKRPSKDDYYLDIALAVSRRGTCLRRRFGAVIVNDDEIVSTGYVGAPRGTKNCMDIGECPRQKAKIPPGERYELCRSVHAEANAIISASRRRMIDGKIYLAGQDLENNEALVEAHPCKMCKRMIINAGIIEVITRTAEGGTKRWLVEDWVKNDITEFTPENTKGY
jgi:dCMP deaminase